MGRYSFLATEPFFEIEAYGTRVTPARTRAYRAGGTPTLVTRQFECDNPLDDVAAPRRGPCGRFICRNCPLSAAARWAMPATIRSAISSDLPHAPPDDRQVPDMAFAFYDQMVVFDNVTKAIVVVAMARLDKPGVTPEAAYQAACRRVDKLVEQLSSPSPELRPFDIRTDGERDPALPIQLHPGRV